MAAVPLDEFDRRLLDALQREVPLVRRPYAALGEALGATEDQILTRLRLLRGRGGIIRQISAVFDSRALGYHSTLVGARVDESHLDAAATVINAHPGVSHNYRREHAFNLWYTLTVPPDSRLGLEQTVEILHARSGCRVTRLMPTLKMYKIGVRFHLSAAAPPPAGTGSPPPTPAEERRPLNLTEADRRMVVALQQDLPLDPQPFDAWAEQAGVTVDQLFAAAGDYLAGGVMRRLAVVLHHRQVGFSANAMGAWIVPPERHDQFGAIAAGFETVSHCYLRPTYFDWPYSMFTMVHGRDRAACEQTLAEISDATGIRAFAALYSTHEYKKVRVRYFSPDIPAWEACALASAHAGSGETSTAVPQRTT